MSFLLNYIDLVPQFDPQIMNGTLLYKIIIKKDHVRKDGTSALYLRLFQNKKRKRIPLHISVPIHQFDENKGLVKKTHPDHESFNLLIGKIKSDVNTILVNYRLSNMAVTLEAVANDLLNPSIRANFNAFASSILEAQKEYLRIGTYRQQKGALEKIKKYQDPLYFSDITEDFVKHLRAHCKNKLKNKPATVESTIKNFKKYLHAANEKGIRTPLKFSDISVKKMTGNRTFLLPEELSLVYEYYQSKFVNPTHKAVLKRYLFSCFTGIRLSDSEKLTADNFMGDYLAITMKKTDKFIRIKLNKTALSLVNLPEVFTDNFTREHINRELKVIASILGIKKRIYFHSSRHTFATNFLMQGGDVVNLQKLLGHSKIDETMIYVHIVESITNKQVDLLDRILKNSQIQPHTPNQGL